MGGTVGGVMGGVMGGTVGGMVGVVYTCSLMLTMSIYFHSLTPSHISLFTPHTLTPTPHSQVKVLYIRNLMLTTTEAQIEEVFSKFAPVERVKKIRDYAFVHFHSKEDAHCAMEAMNGRGREGGRGREREREEREGGGERRGRGWKEGICWVEEIHCSS